MSPPAGGFGDGNLDEVFPATGFRGGRVPPGAGENEAQTRFREALHDLIRPQLLVTSLGGALQAPPYPSDCGLDLVTSEDAVVRRSSWANIPCGVAVALPTNTFGYIVARSSTWLRYGIIVIPGVIDEGWRGQLFTMAYRPALAFSHYDYNPIIPKGTRLSQLLVLPNLVKSVRVTPVDELPPSDRGERGFGSSG